MRSVLLRLEGPLQSWGTRSRFGRRDTENEPSKSGVLGLVGAALGMSRDDDELLARLAKASFAVRVDREGVRLSDYHTVGDGTFRGEPYFVYEASNAVPTHREYLQDASFLAALGFEDIELAQRVAEALASPCWPLCLGRRSCQPSLPVHVPDGLVSALPEDALRGAVYLSSKRPKDAAGEERSLRMLVECGPNDLDAEPRQDQPLSFRLQHRHFARRFVRATSIKPEDIKLLPAEAPCISLVAS